MNYLITGAKGQLGTELTKMVDEKDINLWAYDSADMDITDREATLKTIADLKPDVIFHCAAYTAVDPAEDDGKEINWKVNVDGTQNVADAAKLVGATMIYISTDYVFDGKKETEYQVNDQPNPQNEYGRAKLAGEEAVRQTLSNYYIIRTSWVFGEYGKNFVYTMLRLAETHDTLTVVNDQVGRPTWTKTLAEFMLYAVEHEIDFGTYQLSNEGSCTWYEFASEILKDTDTKVLPVTSAEFSQKAYRPEHSVMSLEKVKKTEFEILSWQQALREFVLTIN
ncbi:dTDP-4-dehydrorhamnose reductase [Heyndrickxia oleronia]|jgi:dTDP-4-dehydrorhamnose reductase|uniref:dTDP-4-dehydrorhamnose reductase n=1 Tax=Heyndrickxia oleronia TaxID=38875 RepID=UPI0024317F50|nr:dTDP-4-dehydrorhamnose reductase [Heyndrickxia oleronia]MCI1593411.1 dTDP-4-dehydrorhamnose reductase [Heyndrickxia oleronia]MCI1746493.1 dTDP-4-dehydrorhamnose reductase [Heyndrickxia oleronia]MCI1764304.1 dTDP-4-dehydrorhamnose reductase [Heyndrickxia oleronia]